jgi:hypothetical protein
MARLTEQEETRDWLKGRKYLINPDTLTPIRAVLKQARNSIQRYALPFPINSISLIPKESMEKLDKELHEMKDLFQNRVEEFEAIYEAALMEAEGYLGEFFNETDYPQDIKNKFNLEWQYLAITLPNKSVFISPEIYKREKEKFETLMDETRETAMIALREEFSGILTFLVDRLVSDNGDKPKILKTGMFTRLREFLTDFESLNLFEDDTLAALTEQAKVLIEDVSAYKLKFDSKKRGEIGQEMQVLKEAIDAAIVDMPRRAIRMDLN